MIAAIHPPFPPTALATRFRSWGRRHPCKCFPRHFPFLASVLISFEKLAVPIDYGERVVFKQCAGSMLDETKASLQTVMEEREVSAAVIDVVDWVDLMQSLGKLRPAIVISVQLVMRPIWRAAIVIAVADDTIDLNCHSDSTSPFSFDSVRDLNLEQQVILRHRMSHLAGFTHERRNSRRLLLCDLSRDPYHY